LFFNRIRRKKNAFREVYNLKYIPVITLKIWINLNTLNRKIMSRIHVTESSCLSKRKLLANEKDFDVVICADTVCEIDGKIIEKPADDEDAFKMLSEFNDKFHNVHTCIWVLVREGSKEFVDNVIVTSRVKFGKVPIESLKEYSKIDVIKNAAGGYQLQGLASSMIESLEGSHTNVIGLPVYELCLLLLNLFSQAGWKL